MSKIRQNYAWLNILSAQAKITRPISRINDSKINL